MPAYRHVLLVALSCSLLLTAGFEAGGRQDKKPRPDKTDYNDVYLEIQALQTLADLRATPSQLRSIAKLAAKTARRPGARQGFKISAQMRKTLLGLRDALVAGDEEGIEKFSEEFEKLRKKEEPEFEDGEMTAAARAEAPKMVRRFNTRQLAAYVGTVAEDIPDPRERLLGALQRARKPKDTGWRGFRDATADQVAGILAGLDTEAEEKLRSNIRRLLERAHSLDAKDKEFKAKFTALQKAALVLAAKKAPFAVMRLFTERVVAELLSNPRLAPVISARLKKLSEKPKKEKPKKK
jgi:hypothetical protein